MPRAPFSLGALACLMGLSLAAALLPAALTRDGVVANYWWTRDLYQFRFHADLLALTGVAALYLIGFLVCLHWYALATPEAPHRRASYLLAAVGSGSVAMLSADLIATLFFLGLFLLAVWLFARADSPREADRMLLFTSLGATLLTLGVLLMWQESGLTAQSELPLTLISSGPGALRGLGLATLLAFLPLLAAFPGHRWLPRLGNENLRGAMAAGTLFAVTGAFLALRLLPGAMPLALVPGFAALSLFLGIVTFLWGAVGAWGSRSLRGVAVWLTVAQSGLFLLALSWAAQSMSTSVAGLQAAALQALVAPPALLALWSVASLALSRIGTDAFPGQGGLLRPAPLAAIAFLLGGLSLAGVPPLPGFWVQRLLLADQPVLLKLLVLLLDVVILLTVLGAFSRTFLRRGTAAPLLPGRWWMGVQLLLVSLVLLALAVGFSGPLQAWSETIVRGLIALNP